MANKPYKIENNPLDSNPLFNAISEPTQGETTTAKKKTGRPMKEDIVRGNSVQEGLTKEYTRATFIVRVDLLERMKNYVYTERLTMKDSINEILEEALDKRERKLKNSGQKILTRQENSK